MSFTRKNVVLSRRAPGSRGPAAPDAASTNPVRQNSEKKSEQHIGTLSSLVNSQPCVSSGSRSLDQLLQHGGIPRGSVALVEEHGTTDFASALLKSFCSQGISEAREGAKSMVICVGIPEWLRALPAVSADTKPVATESKSTESMRIAWRYQLSSSGPPSTQSPQASYCRDFNFRSNLIPAPRVGTECSYVLGTTLDQLLTRLKATLARLDPDILVRIVVPSLLHPAIYTAPSCEPQQIVPFLHNLRLLTLQYSAISVVSLPLLLFPRTQALTATLERLVDTCIELEPFDAATDVKEHGFLHVHRLPDLSDRGAMVERRHEFAFTLSKRQFEVTPFGIPVDAGPESGPNQPSNSTEEVF